MNEAETRLDATEARLDDTEKRVAPLELFFDLVFVFALTQVTLLMSNKPTWEGLGEGILVLVALWWAWGAYAWLTNYIATDEGVERLLMFAAILVSLILRSTASGLRRVFPFLGELSAFYLATILGVGLLAGSGYMLGAQLRGELQDIWDQLSELFVPLEDWLGLEDIEQWLVERGEELFSEISVLYWIVGVSSAMAGVIANAVLILAAAFYFGLQPQIYRGGLVMLLPPSLRPSAEGALDAISYGLRRWIMGQLVAMLLVGILTYVGLSLLGVPSALALAVIAGLLEFIPFIGPILAAVPALAIALAQSPQLALWVLALYVLIQQVESNLLTPIIQQRAVRLPPVATLFAVIASGLLFGFLGILLATPHREVVAGSPGGAVPTETWMTVVLLQSLQLAFSSDDILIVPLNLSRFFQPALQILRMDLTG
jgi:predicted PurR-regulated permease PerM